MIRLQNESSQLRLRSTLSEIEPLKHDIQYVFASSPTTQLDFNRKPISKTENQYFLVTSTLNLPPLGLLSVLLVVIFAIFSTNLAVDTYLRLFLNLLTHPASSCPSLSLPSLTFTCFFSPWSLSLPLSLCVNREGCLNFLQHRAATPHFDDFAVKADILRINIWFCTCIICACGGTQERNREKSQCKLSSKIALEKWHHSCGRSAGLEASFLGFLMRQLGKQVREIKMSLSLETQGSACWIHAF